MQTLKVIVAPSGKEKIEIYRRDDGRYTFDVWYWSEDPYERCWLPRGYQSILADAAMAEAEARARVDWQENGASAA